jgi:lysophospholipase L1-like esterase
MKKWLVNALLVLGALVVVLSSIEAVFSLADYDYRPLTISARDDLRDSLAFTESSFEFDADLLWRPRSGFEIFNSQGFRGPMLADSKAPGEVRIITIGDSNTLGWRGEDGVHWPGLVAKFAGPPVKVINAGVWGYASLQGRGRLEEALPYAPDIVTISFGSNDAVRVRVADAQRVGRGPTDSWLKALAARSRLGRVALGALGRVKDLASGSARVARVSLDDYRDNLRAMVSRARQAGAIPVLMTRPYIGVSADPDYWLDFGPDYNAATFEMARELDVPLIDFYTLFKHREDLFADDSHFTDEGHALAARWAWQELRPQVESLARSSARPGSSAAVGGPGAAKIDR